jgi:hypothetical protein
MALRPRFNFARLLEDLAVQHNIPPPVFIPAVHPWLDHVAILCTYSGVSALGDGLSVEGARIAAARQVWIGLGHLISIDPRYVFYLFYIYTNFSFVWAFLQIQSFLGCSDCVVMCTLLSVP